MITQEQREILHDIINKYPDELQIIIAIEECSELIKALTKHLRGYDSADCIAEEMADVYIMLEELKIIFDNHKEVCNKINEKILRTAGIYLD